MSSYKYKSDDGLAQSNVKSFVDSWNDSVKDVARQEREWIAKLRKMGVKAAHPDDGWVNRDKQDSVQLVYPQFNDGLEIGDRLALGWAWSKTRIVKIIAAPTEGIINPHTQYYLKADTAVNDLAGTSSKPTQTHTKSAQSDPKRKANT